MESVRLIIEIGKSTFLACPQNLHPWTSPEQTFLQDWDDGWQSEDMLKLNIWTPILTGMRPVMFYMRCGGFSFGSSYELAAHDGAQMARHHDVVQVSVNHPLNILGFFDLSEISGSAFEDSANVGMTDLGAALRWVHDNIDNFGGDPDRVMIYGQSGGGSKVTTLMGMASAAGLSSRRSAIRRRWQHSRQGAAKGTRAPDDEGPWAGV
jgi:para-nitrobenzyl esterase